MHDNWICAARAEKGSDQVGSIHELVPVSESEDIVQGSGEEDPEVKKLLDDKIEKVAFHMRRIIDALGLDINDPNLRDTDKRVAKMYLEMFSGLQEAAEPRITTFPNEEGYNEMVMVKDVPFYSMCSHHFVPFYGHAHIAYIPNDRIVGLSKLPRIVEFYARRPQLQERLTEQVINFVNEKLQPQGCMVVVEARHMCMEMRGVQKPGAMTTTSAIRGVFTERAVREEFLDLLKLRR